MNWHLVVFQDQRFSFQPHKQSIRFDPNSGCSTVTRTRNYCVVRAQRGTVVQRRTRAEEQNDEEEESRTVL